MSKKLQSGDPSDQGKYDRNRMYGRLSVMSRSERKEYFRELREENDRDMVDLFHQVNIELDKDHSSKLHQHDDDSELAEMVHEHIRENVQSFNALELLECRDMLDNYFPARRDIGRGSITQKSMTLVDGAIERLNQEADRKKSKLQRD